MTDIDFDELDKAINSLVSSDSKQPAPAGDTAPAPVAQPAPTAPVIPPRQTPAPQPQPTAGDNRVPGRFMDVMHPSSDMRPGVNVPERNTRQGVTITPPAPAEATVQPADPTPVEAPVQASPSMPQPIAASSIPTTPFLKDAQVEKRPLGGPIQPPASEENKLEESTEQSSDTDTPLPAELQPNVLSLESDNPQAQIEEDSFTATPLSPVVQPHSQDQPIASNQDSIAPAYNAGVYQQGLAHPPKKKAGWLWILWIVIILIAGVGAGAAMYFFVLPLL